MNIDRSRYALRDLVLATLAALLFFAVVAPSLSHAATDELPPPQGGLALPTIQLWTLVAGAVMPLVTYVVNYRAPWMNEKIKTLVQVVGAALAGALVQAIDAGDVGFNDGTFQIIVTSIIGALFAHRLLWRPSGVSTSLGGGRNIQENPAR